MIIERLDKPASVMFGRDHARKAEVDRTKYTVAHNRTMVSKNMAMKMFAIVGGKRRYISPGGEQKWEGAQRERQEKVLAPRVGAMM